jgi:hypothetical protein
VHPVGEVELAVLRRLVSVDFPGVEELRAQIETIREVESNCTCGCPSFTPRIDRNAAPPAPVGTLLPTELVEEYREGGVPRTVIWFADRDGFIANIECVYYDDAIDEWPDPSRCTLVDGLR